MPEPEESESSVEPRPPVKHADERERSRLVGGEQRERRGNEYREHEGRTAEPSVEPVSARADGRRDSEVERAKAEAEKARAEAEAEKARAEAETARAEAEAAKARARAEQARAEAETEAIGGDPPGTPELDGGTVVGEQQATGASPSSDKVDPAFSAPSIADGFDSDTAADTAESPAEGTTAAPADGSEKWGVTSDAELATEGESATAVDPSVDDSDNAVDADSATDPASAAGPSAPLRTEEPLQAETVHGETDGEGATVVDDEFESFVAADPVEEDGSEASVSEPSTDDEGISRWAGESPDDVPEETGEFEF